MKNIIIIGAGGFGREVKWLLDRINEKQNREIGENVYNILGYIDDGMKIGTDIGGKKVLGGVNYLMNQTVPLAVVCAIGVATTRKKVIDKIRNNKNLYFPNLIDPLVQKSDWIEWGEGNIVCAGNIFTVNIRISDFCIINLGCTLGHDVILDSFITLYPNVKVSGCVWIGECSEVGTGTQIIQGKVIGTKTIIGAGSVVVKDIPSECTAVGNPCKPIKFLENRGGGGVNLINAQKMSATNGNDKFSMDINKALLILGASGHGKVVAEIATLVYDEIFFIDDNLDMIDSVVDIGSKKVSVVGNSSYAVVHKDDYDVFVAIGNSKVREKLNLYLKRNGVSLISLVHPDATVAADVKIGIGTVVLAHSVINNCSKLGEGVIVNTGATIDHDNRIDDYVHIAVGAHLAGTIKVGEHTWIGAGAIISNDISICDNCTIGAGAVVISNICERGTYIGVPARKLLKNSK